MTEAEKEAKRAAVLEASRRLSAAVKAYEPFIVTEPLDPAKPPIGFKYEDLKKASDERRAAEEAYEQAVKEWLEADP